jgi:hypothetical protein
MRANEFGAVTRWRGVGAHNFAIDRGIGGGQKDNYRRDLLGLGTCRIGDTLAACSIASGIY